MKTRKTIIWAVLILVLLGLAVGVGAYRKGQQKAAAAAPSAAPAAVPAASPEATEAPQAAAYNPYQNYIEYKIHPRPSSGKQRLEQSKKAFKNERK